MAGAHRLGVLGILVAALLDVTARVALALPVPADHACMGRWVGRGQNTGYTTWWTIDLTLTAAPSGARCGTIEYANPDCGGTLERCQLVGGDIHTQEVYTVGTENCAPAGRVIIRCEGERMRYSWIGWERVDSILHRPGASPAGGEGAPDPPPPGPGEVPPRDGEGSRPAVEPSPATPPSPPAVTPLPSPAPPVPVRVPPQDRPDRGGCAAAACAITAPSATRGPWRPWTTLASIVAVSWIGRRRLRARSHPRRPARRRQAAARKRVGGGRGRWGYRPARLAQKGTRTPIG